MRIARKSAVCMGVTASVVAALAPAAFAATTIEVDGATTPPSVVITSGALKGSVTFTTNYGFPTTCTGSTISGTIHRGGTATAGNIIGAINTMTLTPCTATTLGYPVNITKKDPTVLWNIVVKTTPTSKAQNLIDVEIRGVDAVMKSTGTTLPRGCDVRAMGTVPAQFKRDTQQLIINTGSSYPLNLVAYDGMDIKTDAHILPAGTGTCFGQIETGDTAKMVGSFAVTTPGVGGIQLR